MTVHQPVASVTEYSPPTRGWWTEPRRESASAMLGGTAVLLVAWALTPEPTGYGTHEHLFLLPCLFKILTGLPCPFCGLTTSFAFMAEGAVQQAWQAHILGPVGYLATWAILAAGVVGLIRNHRPLPQWLFSQPGGRTMLAVILVGWIVNLVRFLSNQ